LCANAASGAGKGKRGRAAATMGDYGAPRKDAPAPRPPPSVLPPAAGTRWCDERKRGLDGIWARQDRHSPSTPNRHHPYLKTSPSTSKGRSARPSGGGRLRLGVAIGGRREEGDAGQTFLCALSTRAVQVSSPLSPCAAALPGLLVPGEAPAAARGRAAAEGRRRPPSLPSRPGPLAPGSALNPHASAPAGGAWPPRSAAPAPQTLARHFSRRSADGKLFASFMTPSVLVYS